MGQNPGSLSKIQTQWDSLVENPMRERFISPFHPHLNGYNGYKAHIVLEHLEQMPSHI